MSPAVKDGRADAHTLYTHTCDESLKSSSMVTFIYTYFNLLTCFRVKGPVWKVLYIKWKDRLGCSGSLSSIKMVRSSLSLIFTK